MNVTTIPINKNKEKFDDQAKFLDNLEKRLDSAAMKERASPYLGDARLKAKSEHSKIQTFRDLFLALHFPFSFYTVNVNKSSDLIKLKKFDGLLNHEQLKTFNKALDDFSRNPAEFNIINFFEMLKKDPILNERIKKLNIKINENKEKDFSIYSLTLLDGKSLIEVSRNENLRVELRNRLSEEIKTQHPQVLSSSLSNETVQLEKEKVQKETEAKLVSQKNKGQKGKITAVPQKVKESVKVQVTQQTFDVFAAIEKLDENKLKEYGITKEKLKEFFKEFEKELKKVQNINRELILQHRFEEFRRLIYADDIENYKDMLGKSPPFRNSKRRDKVAEIWNNLWEKNMSFSSLNVRLIPKDEAGIYYYEFSPQKIKNKEVKEEKEKFRETSEEKREKIDKTLFTTTVTLNLNEIVDRESLKIDKEKLKAKIRELDITDSEKIEKIIADIETYVKNVQNIKKVVEENEKIRKKINTLEDEIKEIKNSFWYKIPVIGTIYGYVKGLGKKEKQYEELKSQLKSPQEIDNLMEEIRKPFKIFDIVVFIERDNLVLKREIGEKTEEGKEEKKDLKEKPKSDEINWSAAKDKF